MTASRHLLVRASAGTGKTHELTTRYLALVLDGVDPARILATTFTRKAAHEIFDRVLDRLARGARGGDGLDGLSRALGRDLTAEECLSALERLLRGIDRIRISTIDAYFAQLARLHALDLGLPAVWRIADEAEADFLRSEAVGDAVAGADPPELLDLLHGLQRQTVGQSVHGELLRSAKDGREALLESASGAWERIRPMPDAAQHEIEAALLSLPDLQLPRVKTGKNAGAPKKNWADSRRRLVDLCARGDWFGVLAVGLAKKVCAGEASYDRVAIEPAQLAILRPLVAHALHVATHRLALQNRAARSLLERFEASWRALCRERGLLRFEDLPDALAPVQGAEPLVERGLDPSHRMDGKVDHLLLDEFQDTAPVQWRVLRPIADGILAEPAGAQSFFCVGDVKQSIYGWRAAEPRLLGGLAEKRASLEVLDLRESHRSSRAVLGTVNLVFARIAENPALAGEKDDADPTALGAAEEFQRSFAEHVQAERILGRKGSAVLWRAGFPMEGEDSHLPVLRLAVERVKAILAAAPRASVGVLLRYRKWIPDLIRRLREEGIAASDQGGNPLTDSVAVLHALSLLHLSDHPGDSAAAFHVASSPWAARFRLPLELFADPNRGEAARERAAEIARERAGEVARSVRRELAVRGFGGFLASIRPEAGALHGDWDLRRYGQLVDLALAWEGLAGSRPAAFVEHVRKAKVEDPSAAQVRVMTVHGAKGLEFDAVVLPDLDGSMKAGERGLWTTRPDPEGPVEVVTHAVAKEVARAHGELETVRAEVARKGTLEELCVMYVAMTRAVHRLDLIVQAREGEGGGFTGAAILRGALGIEATGGVGEAWRHAENTDPWYPPELAQALPASSAWEGPPRPLRLAPSRRARCLRTLSPSSAKDAGIVRAASVLRPRSAITARGRLVHRWLAEVEWIEDFDRADAELLAIGRGLEADETALVSALRDFRASLARPRTRELLSRGSAGGDAEVWRERPFALVLPGPDGGEVLASGAFDRVVLRRAGGAALSAEIVDFKTDRVAGDALRERAEIYRPQMDAYRRALARMLSLEETSIRARLAFLEADLVLEV